MKTRDLQNYIARMIKADPDNAEMAKLGYEPLFSVSPKARVAIIGQAPGRVAQERQLAWSDASGDKLVKWLGVTEAQFRDSGLFAILPMDFYYPGKGASGDLPPRRGFADKWHPKALKGMPDIKLIMLVGRYAQEHYLGARRKRTLTETVRSFREYLPEFFPVVHPSPLNFRWQAKNPWFEAELLPVLQDIVAGCITR